MSTEPSTPNPAPGTNTGPIDPAVLAKAKSASKPDARGTRPEESHQGDGAIDPDAPARAVLFPDEDAPEPNEPG